MTQYPIATVPVVPVVPVNASVAARMSRFLSRVRATGARVNFFGSLQGEAGCSTSYPSGPPIALGYSSAWSVHTFSRAAGAIGIGTRQIVRVEHARDEREAMLQAQAQIRDAGREHTWEGPQYAVRCYSAPTPHP